jgi:hypothetical protein
MTSVRIDAVLAGALRFLLLALLGCTVAPPTRPYLDPPPDDLVTTRIDYVDTDAFDTLLESALVNQDPVIVIQTANALPDWDGRLNAWIAAWNRGGKVEASDGTRKVRMQAPFVPTVVVDSDSIRELRLLVEALMSRIEVVAREKSQWWRDERTQARRVDLLRPYNLRFHRDKDGRIQIVLFNGRHARHYSDVMLRMGMATAPEEWVREFSCSTCRRR